MLGQRQKEVRKIDELSWVKMLEQVHMPWPRATKLTLAQKKGNAYEKKVLKLIESLLPGQNILHGVWYQFEDRQGRGLAQPDYTVKTRKCVYVFEVKLTHTRHATHQLQDLYGPLVSMYYKLPATLVEVCKNLTPDKEIHLIRDISHASANGRVSTIHWLS